MKTSQTLPFLFFFLCPSAATLLAQSTVRPLPGGMQAWTRAANDALAINQKKATEASSPRGEADASPASDSPSGLSLGPVSAVPANAAAPSADEEAATGSRTLVELDMRLMARSNADLVGFPGTFAVQRGGWNVRLGWLEEDGSLLGLHLGSEASFYNFNLGAPLPIPGGSVDPFNDLYETRIGIDWLKTSGPKLTYQASLELLMAGEDLVALDDGLMYGGLLGVRYRATEDFALNFGLAAQTRLEDDAWIFPYLGFAWGTPGGTQMQTEGPHVGFAVGINDAWSLRLDAIYEVREWRLNQDGPFDGGIFREEEISLSAGVDWRLNVNTTFTLTVGQNVWDELDFMDADGNTIVEADGATSTFVTFGIRLGF